MQPNESYIAEIKQIIDNNPSHYVQIIHAQKNAYLCAYIEAWCEWMSPLKFKFSTKCWYAINKYNDFVQCITCGSKIIRDVVSISRPGLLYCNMECVHTSDEVHNKIRTKHLSLTEEQKQEKYRKRRQTKYERYGDENFTNREKAKNTCNERYGVDNVFQAEWCKKKSEQTRLERYGNPRFVNPEKISISHWARTEDQKAESIEKQKISCQKKYGYDFALQCPEIRDKGNVTKDRHRAEDPNYTNKIVEKCRQTNILNGHLPNWKNHEKANATTREHYGVDCFWSSQAYKDLWKTEAYKDQIVTKVIESKRRNGTFNTSAPENRIYDALVLKFGSNNVIRQHKDKDRYPFHCDFYIKTLDLFIEFNGSWTHGGHQYDPNSEEDRLKVEKLRDLAKTRKQKTGKKSMYETELEVWTQKDPKKYEAAAKHSLHYLVFWTEDEAMSWISNVP